MLGPHGRPPKSSRLRSRPASDRWSIVQSPYFSSLYTSRRSFTKELATLRKPSHCTKAPCFLFQHLRNKGHDPRYPSTSPSSLLLTQYLLSARLLTPKIILSPHLSRTSSLSAYRTKATRFAPPIISLPLRPHQKQFFSQSNISNQLFKTLSRLTINISCAWFSISCPGSSSVALWATRRRGAPEPARVWLISA